MPDLLPHGWQRASIVEWKSSIDWSWEISWLTACITVVEVKRMALISIAAGAAYVIPHANVIEGDFEAFIRGVRSRTKI